MRAPARDQGQRWLEQARVDLHWVRHLAEQGAFYLVCFLAQQAAEKALKAILYAAGQDLVLGHSVRQLAQQVAETGGGRFEGDIDRWAVLDSYYIPTRYPNGLPDDIPANVYNREAATSAVTLVEEVLLEVEGWFERTAPGNTDLDAEDGEDG